jgi:hypothetical protein
LFLVNIENANLLLLAIGYWMLSNPKLQQSYDNLTPKGLHSEPADSLHLWYNVLTTDGIKMSGSSFALLAVFLLDLGLKLCKWIMYQSRFSKKI